jgi:hypothetical protein
MSRFSLYGVTGREIEDARCRKVFQNQVDDSAGREAGKRIFLKGLLFDLSLKLAEGL